MSEQTKQITKTQKDAVRGMIEKIEKELNPRKATLGHYIRLLQLQRELEADEPTDIEVKWVEDKSEDSDQ